jgi:hypothetical protein
LIKIKIGKVKDNGTMGCTRFVHTGDWACPRFVHARWQAFGQHLIIGSCAASSFIALEPGGLLLFLSQKSNQKARKKIIYRCVSI